MADWRKRQHSCEKRLHAQAARERGQARRAAVDRTPKPCLHKRADHQHGTYAAYVLDGCKCPPCAKANSEYEKNRIRQKAYGRWTQWVDAEPLRAHLRGLLDAGMGSKRILEVSGLSSGTWTKVMYGTGGRPPSKRMSRDLAIRIAAIPFDPAPGRHVPALGTTRRLQALIALGWSGNQLAARLGIGRRNFTCYTDGTRRGVTLQRERDIRALYDTLAMLPPPERNQRERIAAARSRNRAEANGWAPPLAWDDDRFDDPTYRPARGGSRSRHEAVGGFDHAVVQRLVDSGERPSGRRLNHAEAVEVLRILRGRDLSDRQIEARYGINPARYPKEGRTV